MLTVVSHVYLVSLLLPRRSHDRVDPWYIPNENVQGTLRGTLYALYIENFVQGGTRGTYLYWKLCTGWYTFVHTYTLKIVPRRGPWYIPNENLYRVVHVVHTYTLKIVQGGSWYTLYLVHFENCTGWYTWYIPILKTLKGLYTWYIPTLKTLYRVVHVVHTYTLKILSNCTVVHLYIVALRHCSLLYGSVPRCIIVYAAPTHCTLCALYTPVHCTLCTLYTLYIVHFVHCTLCTLYTLYIVHFVHCTLYSVQFVHCTLCTLYTLYIVYCTLCTLYTLCIVHFVHCTLCALHTLYIVHFVHCTLCTLYTLYIVHFVHCTLCTLYTLYIVHFVHCTLCTLYTELCTLYTELCTFHNL